MTNTLIAPTTDEKLESVSRKFALLMARSKATDSANEAENCVALAQKMLWENELDESQLLTLGQIEKRKKKQYIKDSVKVGKSADTYNNKFNSREWKADLLSSIAKNFFCKLQASWYNEYDTIVGEPQNVQMVKDMFAYLEKQIRASRKVAFKLAEPGLPRAYSRYYGTTNKPQQFEVHAWKESFAKGAVAAIIKRLEETQRQNVEDADTNIQSNNNSVTPAIGKAAALVVQIFDELDEAYYEFFPDEHPRAIKLARYKRDIEYRDRMAKLEEARKEREARIEAGLEEPEPTKEPVVYKEYKRRGRKPQWRSTERGNAYRQGSAAGNSMQLHTAVKGGRTALNK